MRERGFGISDLEGKLEGKKFSGEVSPLSHKELYVLMQRTEFKNLMFRTIWTFLTVNPHLLTSLDLVSSTNLFVFLLFLSSSTGRLCRNSQDGDEDLYLSPRALTRVTLHPPTYKIKRWRVLPPPPWATSKKTQSPANQEKELLSPRPIASLNTGGL